MIRSRGVASETHFDINRMKYVSLVKSHKLVDGQIGVPTDLIRYINEFIPEYTEITADIPIQHSVEGDEHPIDNRFLLSGGGYDDDGNFDRDYIWDVDYVIEKAKDFVQGHFLGFGYAEVRIRDHPSDTNTYKTLDDESVEHVRKYIEKHAHPFLKAMKFRYRNKIIEVECDYEPSTNELWFDYKIV